ncbi:type II toxin-antitoxin system RelE/ParE family toxin [Dyadobacter crusticola]|uniref:type II toxin-antitoxin system RelE/ParE family toxin n=1 Tax=Dyadobacter crusticola TaxID=292407 RepID=UPI000A066179
MAYEIKWTADARRDYTEVISYLYDQWGFESADLFTDKLKFQLDLLREYPFMGKKHRTIGSLHEFVLGKHQTLYYTVFDNTVLVMDIRDNRRSK